jgi:hypothetical protein
MQIEALLVAAGRRSNLSLAESVTISFDLSKRTGIVYIENRSN